MLINSQDSVMFYDETEFYLSYPLFFAYKLYGPFKNIKHISVFLTFIGPCIANILAEYNQQDATFHNLFISVRRSTCFGRKNCPKHVERLTEINKLWNVASCWLYSANIFRCVCWDAVDQILFCPGYRWLLLYNSLCFHTFQRQIRQYDSSHCIVGYTCRTEGVVTLSMFTAWTVWMCLMCSFCHIYVNMLTRPAFSVKCLLNTSTRYWCKLLQILFWLLSTQKVSGIYIWCECIQSHFSFLMFPQVLVILWHGHLYFSVLLLFHLSPTSFIWVSLVHHYSLYLSIYSNESPPPLPISSQKDILPFGAEVLVATS